MALKESKPVYISISCNLPGIPPPSAGPYSLAPKIIRTLFDIQARNLKIYKDSPWGSHQHVSH